MINANVHLIEDGKTVWKGSLGKWSERTPTSVQHLLRPGPGPKPYTAAMRDALLQASVGHADVVTVIEGTVYDDGWGVRVTRKPNVATKTSKPRKANAT